MSHCLCPSAPKRTKQDVGIPAAGSQGLNSPQSHNISVCGCQGGRGLLLRCGTNEAQRLNMQVWPCSTPYGTWGGLPCLWQVTDGGWGRLCLKINLMGGFAWANSCSSDCIQHECFDPWTIKAGPQAICADHSEKAQYSSGMSSTNPISHLSACIYEPTFQVLAT